MSSQIVERISDERKEEIFQYVDEDGLTREVRITEYPVIDDIAQQAVDRMIGEIVLGREYESLMDYDLVSSLIRTRVPVVR
jgi:hypothetical protein